jgi:hypothetical protein
VITRSAFSTYNNEATPLPPRQSQAIFDPPLQNVFQLQCKFARHHPIDFSSVETAVKIPTKVRQLTGRTDQSPGLRGMVPREATAPVFPPQAYATGHLPGPKNQP